MMGLETLKKGWKQTGGVIVLTALALPFFLGCVGLAIDVGNLYIHKSRLQNTADAAALAGGREFANNQEDWHDDMHPQADAKAATYVNLDMGTLGGGTLAGQRYKAQQADEDTIYYGVRLTENVPLYFMRIFGMDEQDVIADATVAIGMIAGSDGGSGRDLFIFRKNLHGVNSIENPDNFNMKGQIVTTFDGTIAFTDGSGDNFKDSYHYDYLQYSTQSNNLQYFFTEKARSENLSANEAIGKGSDYAHQEIYEQYDMEELGEAAAKRLNIGDIKDIIGEDPGAPDWSSINYNINWIDSAAVKAFNDQQEALQKQQQAHDNYSTVYQTAWNEMYNGKKEIHSSDLTEDLAWSAPPSTGDGNASIIIDDAISGGESAEPIYVYLDSSIYQVNFNVNASNERPLIVVYEGTGRFQMNMLAGTTFRGIVYAPHINDGEGLLINAKGGTFSGTIIANAINLQGGKGTYRYENFGINGGSGGSGGTKTVNKSSAVKLAPGSITDWT